MAKYSFWKRCTFILSMMICLSIVGVQLSGCASLKKKFTRKKKKSNKPEFIPVLDPIDYPKRTESAYEAYSYHHSLAIVWQKKTEAAIKSQESDKRQLYYAGQLKIALEEMGKWIPAGLTEQKSSLDVYMQKFLDKYARPKAMRDHASLLRALRKVESPLRNEFNPRLLVDSFPK